MHHRETIPDGSVGSGDDLRDWFWGGFLDGSGYGRGGEQVADTQLEFFQGLGDRAIARGRGSLAGQFDGPARHHLGNRQVVSRLRMAGTTGLVFVGFDLTRT